MGASPGSQFNNQPSMFPPRQQLRPGNLGLRTSLNFVSTDVSESLNAHERVSNSDRAHESPSESASSRETWPTADNLVVSKEKEKENGFPEHSVVRHVPGSDTLSLRDIAKDRVDAIAERMQNLPDDYLEKFKTELRSFLEGVGGSHQREELLFLQKLVQNRSDLSDKSLLAAHRVQLEVLVAIKTGIQAFLHPGISLSQASLIDIFLYKRCRNISCGGPVPVDDCNCELCSKRNGFCSLCMCTLCSKFDFEFNTCRWIGCDFCSHWAHTDCAIHNGMIGIKNGEMVFSCRACGRTSELLGWVKDVFQQCAQSWDRDTFVRELDYVNRIFQGSDDPRGRKLFLKCQEQVEKMKNGAASVPFKEILVFFQEIDAEASAKQESEESGRIISPQEAFNRIADVVREAERKMEMVAEEKMRSVKKARLAVEACDQELNDKSREAAALNAERQRKKAQVSELESIVRLKQAEADMFALKANEARREAERLQRIASAKTTDNSNNNSKIDEEDYASRYLKQKLDEAEAEKAYLREKIKLEGGGGGGGGGTTAGSRGGAGFVGGSEPYSRIHDMIKNIYSSSNRTAKSTADGQSGDVMQYL